MGFFDFAASAASKISKLQSAPAPTVVYVAGPYSGDTHQHIRKALMAAESLVDAGFVPLVPHLHHLWDLVSPQPYEYWMQIVTTLLLRTDVVLRIGGHSPGADREVRLARQHGIPVYDDLLDLINDKKRIRPVVEGDWRRVRFQSDEEDRYGDSGREPRGAKDLRRFASRSTSTTLSNVGSGALSLEKKGPTGQDPE